MPFILYVGSFWQLQSTFSFPYFATGNLAEALGSFVEHRTNASWFTLWVSNYSIISLSLLICDIRKDMKFFSIFVCADAFDASYLNFELFRPVFLLYQAPLLFRLEKTNKVFLRHSNCVTNLLGNVNCEYNFSEIVHQVLL